MSTIFEHGYALIVGVNDNRIQRLALPDVAKDVQAVYEVLVHPERCAYKPENVKLLKGEESTRQNILEGLYWLQDKVKEDGEATAVIYYSGHGMVDKNTDQYYLVPYDIQELSRLRAHALRAEDLTAEISAVNAKRMLAILDCCHAGGMDVKDVDLEAIDASANVEAAAFPLELPETKSVPLFEAAPGEKSVHDLKEGDGRAILNSSTGAQSSFVRTDRAMSLFTYHLIEALTGHAPHPDDATVVYVTDVMSWVTHQVKKSAREQGRDQTPVMRTSGVFPIAQLIGGQGLSKGIGQLPPDPLEPLPPASGGMQAGGSIVTGTVTAGGDFIGRDRVVHGDE
ncbi:MAG: caspase family protein, partial [Chloroflexota bacterium]